MRKALRAPLPALALCLLMMSPGCSAKLSKQTNLAAAELFAIGEKKAEQKKYSGAAEAFQLLIERYPTSPLAARAQFGLAQNRMLDGSDVEAEVAFDDFLRLYPADPRVPDALFLKGELLARQVLAPERDQTKTREAVKAYSLFLEKEPSSPRAAEAARKVRDLRNRLARHEVAVVSNYMSRKLYESAAARARRALAEFPDVPSTPTLMALLAKSLEKEGLIDDAAEAKKVLAEKFPGYEGEKWYAGLRPLGADDPGPSYRGRKGRYEVTLQSRYVASKDIDGNGGSKLELDPAPGFGLGFGYNFTNHVALHLDGSWARSDYQATIATTDTDGNPTGPTTAGGTLDTATVALNVSYYILDGPLTPFLLGGIGWTFADSNIPSGPPQGVCWYDPWYGYVCTSYQNTYTKSYFSYNLGLGARWDVISGFFLRGSVVWQWIDLGQAGTTDFMGGRLDLGYMF
ncbi:MAG TPA: outer membrane protein assembly factor BamD [Candidatus Deferrimicrobiaceae bacterium]